MRQTIIALVALLSMTAPLGATEPEPLEARDPKIIATTMDRHEPGLGATLRLSPVEVESRSDANHAPSVDLPARGSFWWVVGAIVVAGVILSVLL